MKGSGQLGSIMRTILIAAMASLTSMAACMSTALAAEVARVRWQVTGTPNCPSGGLGECRIYFPQVAANRLLDIQFVSCVITTNEGVLVNPISLGINDYFSPTRHQLVAFKREGTAVLYEVSQPMVFSIAAGQRPQIGFSHFGSINLAVCTLSGELIFLQ
jgi:hypothetical protein